MLEWKTGNGAPFPLPVEVEVRGQVQTVPMTGGRGEIALPAGAHYVIDPYGKVLRQSDVVDEFEAWQAAQRRRN